MNLRIGKNGLIIQTIENQNRLTKEKFRGCNKFLKDELHEKKYQELLFQHERTGRPLGSDLRIDKLEVLLRKQLRNKKTGLKGPWEERGNQ